MCLSARGLLSPFESSVARLCDEGFSSRRRASCFIFVSPSPFFLDSGKLKCFRTSDLKPAGASALLQTLSLLSFSRCPPLSLRYSSMRERSTGDVGHAKAAGKCSSPLCSVPHHFTANKMLLFAQNCYHLKPSYVHLSYCYIPKNNVPGFNHDISPGVGVYIYIFICDVYSSVRWEMCVALEIQEKCSHEDNKVNRTISYHVAKISVLTVSLLVSRLISLLGPK